jgi:hypothetical protein
MDSLGEIKTRLILCKDWNSLVACLETYCSIRVEQLDHRYVVTNWSFMWDAENIEVGYDVQKSEFVINIPSKSRMTDLSNLIEILKLAHIVVGQLNKLKS